MKSIELIGLTKRFGSRSAVENLNLEVASGEIFGFVGPNGSGKTTTIRMIAGLLLPSKGKALVNGYSVEQSPIEIKGLIGYMPDRFGVYPDVTVWEYLDFFGACYKIEAGKRIGLIEGLLELVDLSHRRMDKVDQLSHGLKQRLSLARTLLHEPQILLLDEPAAGLDPRARVEIRALLAELSRMGKTIFFSSHILTDVAELCSRVGIIEAGVLVAAGTLEELKVQSQHHRKIELIILGKLEQSLEILGEKTGIENISIQQAYSLPGRIKINFEFEGDDSELSELVVRLFQAEIPLLRFSENEQQLEDIFLNATQGIVS